MGKVAEALASLPPVTVYEPEYVPKPPVVDTSEPLDIQRLDDGHTWLIQGPWLQRLMANVNFDDYESRMWFDKALRESGLYQQLEERASRTATPSLWTATNSNISINGMPRPMAGGVPHSIRFDQQKAEGTCADAQAPSVLF